MRTAYQQISVSAIFQYPYQQSIDNKQTCHCVFAVFILVFSLLLLHHFAFLDHSKGKLLGMHAARFGA